MSSEITNHTGGDTVELSESLKKQNEINQMASFGFCSWVHGQRVALVGISSGFASASVLFSLSYISLCQSSPTLQHQISSSWHLLFFCFSSILRIYLCLDWCLLSVFSTTLWRRVAHRFINPTAELTAFVLMRMGTKMVDVQKKRRMLGKRDYYYSRLTVLELCEVYYISECEASLSGFFGVFLLRTHISHLLCRIMGRTRGGIFWSRYIHSIDGIYVSR